GLEAEKDAELRDGNPGLREVEDAVSERLPERAAAADWALLVDQRRREVDLADDPRDVCHLSPPIAGAAIRVRRAVDEQPGLRPTLPQCLQEEEDVRAVLRVRLRPRNREPRP